MLLAPSIVMLPQPAMRGARMLKVVAEHGLAPPRGRMLEAARALAERLMDTEVASLEVFQDVINIQPTGFLAYCEDGEVTAVTGQLFMRREAARRLLDGRFDGVNLDTSLLARDGEHPAVAYSWGVAAATKEGGKAIFAGSGAMKKAFFPDVTVFTRAVTGAGRHVALTRYGYRPLRHPDDDILVNEPVAATQEQAA